jgi:sn-glycerol 3-phosphate transport system ATP-binding protein
MNLLPARAEAGGRVLVLAGGARLSAAAPVAAGDVVVGVRPEHMEVGAKGGAIEFLVDLVEALGADTVVHGRLGGDAFTFRLPGGTAVAAGQRLTLGVAPENVHVFSSDTGRRLN